MQIISLNMHDTKMAQAKINSTEKIGLGTTKKLLVPKFIELLWEYPCLLYLLTAATILKLHTTLLLCRGWLDWGEIWYFDAE